MMKTVKGVLSGNIIVDEDKIIYILNRTYPKVYKGYFLLWCIGSKYQLCRIFEDNA